MIKKLTALIRAKREAARRKKVARFMRNQSLGSYYYFIGLSDD